MKRSNIVWLCLLALAVSCSLAFVVVRLQALWFLIPAWLATGVERLLGVPSQESSSDAEFLSAWLVCLALVFGVALIWRFTNRQFFARRKS